MDKYIREIINKRSADQNQIRGSLFGGAVGDALGYAIEFSSEQQIFEKYGTYGLISYDIDPVSGKALISDDTQMTLFTANGLLVGSIGSYIECIMRNLRGYVELAYLEWLKTQTMTYDEFHGRGDSERQYHYLSWLMNVPEMFSVRAPGNTCLTALDNIENNIKKNSGLRTDDDYINKSQNNSKGCGGIMRTAPVALCYRPGINYPGSLETLDMEAAQIAAITHGHSLGYMPSAVLNHIISRIITDKGNHSLKSIIVEARDTAVRLFIDDPNVERLYEIITTAIHLAENTATDLDNIHILGEGWVAEETLAIAIYCSLRHQNDFTAGIIAAVNHSGDSDSTGAVTGNILGAWLGFDSIEKKWKKRLELADVIIEMADDLCYGCILSESGPNGDQAFATKYMKMQRYNGNYQEARKGIWSNILYTDNITDGYANNANDKQSSNSACRVTIRRIEK